ncbi:MAG: ROK family protein [Acidobacteria bacterium]|nr:ROK family protein [Acidobacteriota bacterium]
MTLLAIDLGGTKLAAAVLSDDGAILAEETVLLNGRRGNGVGALIAEQIRKNIEQHADEIDAVGICVPGISRRETGTVWAPNIPGWDDYPLLAETEKVAEGSPVFIDSDRACHILGEEWKGAAQGCRNAVYLAVGTGIGAGILADGSILRGAHDIAGAVGWMALERPFDARYVECGCFETNASGEGLAKLARRMLAQVPHRPSVLRAVHPNELSAGTVFEAYEAGDETAQEVIAAAIEFWGMAAANMVSIFDPEKVLFGGGMFGPAGRFLEQIRDEAKKWAQPIAIERTEIVLSELGPKAGLYGAARMALKALANGGVKNVQ